MWIALKAAAARHGTSAWSPNPPTLLPWYPLQLRFVLCTVSAALFSPHAGDGLSTPKQTGAALSGSQAQGTRGKKGDESTDGDGPCFAPNNDVFWSRA